MALVPDTARFKGVSPAAEAAAYPAAVGPPPPRTSLEICVLGFERPRATLCLRLAARTNLGAYRHASYPPFVRSYREIALLAFALTLRHPETIVHALPVPFPALVPTPSPADDEPSSPANAALVQAQQDIFLAQLTKWLSRTTSDPALMHDIELRRFVEAEYSYAPHPPDGGAPAALRKRFSHGMAALSHAANSHFRPVDISGGAGQPLGLPSATSAPSGGAAATAKHWAGAFLSFARGGTSSSSESISGPVASSSALATSLAVHDQDAALVAAREEVTRLELQYAQAAGAAEHARQAGAAQRVALVSLTHAMDELAAGERLRPMAVTYGEPELLTSLSHHLRLVAGADAHCAARSALTLGDMLAFQSLNARAAKEALLVRASMVENYWSAAHAASQRKAVAEAARSGAGGYDPEQTEQALGLYADAATSAQSLGSSLATTSQGLRTALRSHSRAAHADLADALSAHATEGLRSAQAQLGQLEALLPALNASLPSSATSAPAMVSPLPDTVEPQTSAQTSAASPSAGSIPDNVLSSTAISSPTPSPLPTSITSASLPDSTSSTAHPETPSVPTLSPTTFAPAPSEPKPVPSSVNDVAPTAASSSPSTPSTTTATATVTPDANNKYQPEDPYCRAESVYRASPLSQADATTVGQGRPQPSAPHLAPDQTQQSPTSSSASAASSWGTQSLVLPSETGGFSFGSARFTSSSFGAAQRARAAAAQGRGGSFGSKARAASRSTAQPSSQSLSSGPAGGQSQSNLAASVPSLPGLGATGTTPRRPGGPDGLSPSVNRPRLSARDAARSLAGAF